MRGYPIPMVHAEKVVTAISRGTANTRWRDFGDIYVLSGLHTVTASDLRQAMMAVAGHRGVELWSLTVVLEGYDVLAQSR
nr:nucleotidyl transferase AbiEii/AbiGii toxin family protein [Planosporangium flavigriseum]